MKRFAVWLLVLLCCLPLALADGIPLYEVYPASPDGRMWIEVPNQYEFVPVDMSHSVAYIIDADAKNPLAYMSMFVHIPEGYACRPGETDFTGFAEDGRAVLDGKNKTPSCTVIERYTIYDFTAVRVNMTGQNYEMIWLEDGGDMYFFMIPLFDPDFAQAVRETAETFHLVEPRAPARCNAADYEYVADEGGVTITRYVGDAARVMIPAEIDGQPVVALGAHAFYETRVTWVSVPDSVTSIGAYCFGGCPYLMTLHLPARLTEVPEGMLESAMRLLQLELPDSVTRIGAGALWGNYYLTELRLPLSLTDIAGGNFVMAEQLRRFTVPEGNTAFKTENHGAVLLSTDGKRFIHYCPWQERTSYTIPAGVEHIDAFAFSDWYSLTSVVVPEGVVTIETAAFMQARSLKRITLPASAVELGVMKNDMGSLNLAPVAGGEGISADAFTAGIAGPVTIIAPAGSAAQAHAETFNMVFEAAEAADGSVQE